MINCGNIRILIKLGKQGVVFYLLLHFASCTPPHLNMKAKWIKKLEPIPSVTSVKIITNKDSLPNDALEVGRIRAIESIYGGRHQFTYDENIFAIKNEVIKYGGNMVLVLPHAFKQDGHKLRAIVYHVAAVDSEQSNNKGIPYIVYDQIKNIVDIDTINRFDSSGRKTGWWIQYLDSFDRMVETFDQASFFAFHWFKKGENWSLSNLRYQVKMNQYRADLKDSLNKRVKPYLLQGRYVINKKERITLELMFEKGILYNIKGFTKKGKIREEIFLMSYNHQPTSYKFVIYSDNMQRRLVVERAFIGERFLQRMWREVKMNGKWEPKPISVISKGVSSTEEIEWGSILPKLPPP